MSLPYNAVRYSLKAAFIAAFASLLSFAPPQAQAQDLYWTAAGPQIMGAELDGSDVRVVHDGTGMAGSSVDIAVTADYVYWTDKEDVEGGGPGGGVWRSDRDGANAALFISNPNASVNWAPQFIALDEANNKIYFSCFYTGLYSADLATGGNVTALGSDSARTTGVGVRGSNELISVTAFNDGIIYSTNIANKTHEQIGWFSGHGGNYGLAYDSATDTAYLTGFNGRLYSYNISSFNETSLLSGLGQPLGVKLSASKTHLVYVEAAENKITAYDIANPAESFRLVSGEGANFGVAIWGDPIPPPPPPPLDLPIVDDFSGGTAGEPITDQPTSDGRGVWRLASMGAHASVDYGVDNGVPTFEPYSKHGQGSVYLDIDSNSTENYAIRFDEVLMRGFSPGAGDPVLFISSRKTDDVFSYGYQLRPWRDGGVATGAPRWAVWYHNGSANEPTGQDHPNHEELILQGLELRVMGNQQRLYYGNGVPLDREWRQTQGTFNSGVEERILAIGVDSSSNMDHWIHPRIKGITISDWTPTFDPPPATAGWHLVDDFDGREVGVLRDLWTTSTGRAEVIENPYGSGRVLRVANGRISHPFTIATGDTATVFFRVRTFGNDDVSLVTGYKAANGSSLLTHAPTQAASQFAFRASGEMQAVDNAASPDHLKKIGDHDAHTWYDVWMVVNNNDNTARYYVKGGAYETQTLLNFEGNEDINHRNLKNEDIVALGIHSFGLAPMLVDQVWVDSGGANLSSPVPAPSFTEPARDNSGPLLASERFDYPTGNLLGQSGGSGWIYEYMNYANLHVGPQVVEPGYSWMNLDVGGNRALASKGDIDTPQVFQSFRTIDTNRIDPSLVDQWGQISSAGGIYVSIIAQGVAPTESPFWGIGLFRSNQERIFLGKGGGEEVGWHFREQSAPALNLEVTSLSLTDKHFLVIKLDDVAQKAYLFANPDPAAGEPAVESAEAELDLTSTIGNWGFNSFRIVGNATGISVDEIRIGTTWASVTPIEGGASGGFASWQEEHFGSETDPTIVGPQADPDGDSIENVIEYALGLDPLVASTAGLPVEAIENIEGQNYLTLTFTRPIGLSDVNYDVGASNDLANWGGAVFVSATDNGDGTENVIYRHNDPITASSRAFLRLEVDLQ